MKSYKPNWRTELLKVCKVLKDNGIDIEKIQIYKAIADGKRGPTIKK